MPTITLSDDELLCTLLHMRVVKSRLHIDRLWLQQLEHLNDATTKAALIILDEQIERVDRSIAKLWVAQRESGGPHDDEETPGEGAVQGNVSRARRDDAQ